MSAANLLAAISKATAEDLTEIDGQITAAENQVSSLKSLRKVIANALGLGKKKASPDSGESTQAKRKRIAEFLMHAGPMPILSIAKHVGASDGRAVAMLLRHAYFASAGSDRWQLSPEGRSAFAKEASRAS